ncbi:N-acetylmuramoyl-L-alanine amidase-like domain-containing protein [Sediminicola sp. 1XM1-17]|uniref:N-acetylmuramoyl-L-alanine amidase-like domain-containing protein n=1 Tax=Sediminicola sp. 1XM1-17 TaxID=3127702 RepID=UPI00307758C7
MKNTLFWIFLLLWFQPILSQEVVCSPKDRTAFEQKIAALQKVKVTADYGSLLATIGKTFLKVPYVAKTLEIGTTESLVVNLQGLDCTTYVENVMAFASMVRKGKTDFDTYLNTLEHIRYEHGKLDGYASRLHYFSQWIKDNENKGLVKDITADLGGLEISKEINFMGTHRHLYPFLKDDTNFKKIQETEKHLNRQPLCILPQDKIAGSEHLIQTGDIIALTTNIKGLDITHTGFALRKADGRIHLLHASTGSMQVEVSELPLADYLKKIKGNTGIMVARPL